MIKLLVSLAAIATIAIGFFKNVESAPPKESIPQTLDEALAKGYVAIDHPKLKGGRSQHIATRNAELIPETHTPKGNEAKINTLPYFATDVNGWRCLSTIGWVLADTQWTYLGTKIIA